MITAIIIDDEMDGRDILQIALQKYCPEVTLLEVCENAQQGLQAISKHQPAIVFLDVQMPGMSGFELLQQCSPIDFEVIFVTAHDQYAIKAIKFSALDYLLKPLDIDDLIQAVNKAKERLQQKSSAFQYHSMLHNLQHKRGLVERMAVPTQNGVEFYNTAEIIYCKAEGSYTRMVLAHQNTLISKNLKDFEHLLFPPFFCRIHNSYLVNMKQVVKYVKGDGGFVVLSNGDHVDISRRKKEEFLKLLDRL